MSAIFSNGNIVDYMQKTKKRDEWGQEPQEAICTTYIVYSPILLDQYGKGSANPISCVCVIVCIVSQTDSVMVTEISVTALNYSFNIKKC